MGVTAYNKIALIFIYTKMTWASGVLAGIEFPIVLVICVMVIRKQYNSC